jgi:tetratricopeptide (TPR) repeat protein
MKYLYALLFLFPFAVLSQPKQAPDSLQQLLRSNVHDSVKIKAYYVWDDQIYTSDSKLDLQINEQIISLCEHRLRQQQLSRTENLFFRTSLARSLNNKGLVLIEESRNLEAMDALTRSYQISHQLHLKQLEAFAINNIGMIYRSMNEHEKALSYYLKSTRIDKTSERDPATLNNIGLCYYDLRDTANAMKYYRLSRKYSQLSGDFLNDAHTVSNMADIFYEAGDSEKSLQYYLIATSLYRRMDNKQGLAYAFRHLGNIYARQQNFRKAISYNRLSYTLSKQYKLLSSERESSRNLYEIYKQRHMSDSALYYFEHYLTAHDKYQKETSNNAMIRKQYQFEFENRRLQEVSRHRKQLDLSREKAKTQAVISWFFGIGILLTGILAFYIRRSLLESRRQNKIIEQQKHLVEEKNREILDSITYAKRLQDAILPPLSVWKSYLPESFILYKPKDIVAGDFYWLEPMKVSSESGFNGILIAAADCTGHGVPGAMVSVVCSNALNRTVKEFGITEPGKILDKVRELVIDTFDSYDITLEEEQQVKDGMDISLCSIGYTSGQLETWSSRQGVLQWAGANNPLWIVRRKADGAPELLEFKPNSQPIGKYANAKQFTTHTIDLHPKDAIYLFTDGFADQFGGGKGKKYKPGKMRELILSVQDFTMDEQMELIDREFETWKHDFDQVDDVCIVGVKL